MIGHDNVITQVVTLAIEVVDAFLYNVPNFGLGEVAGAVAGVKPPFKFQTEAFIVFLSVFVSPRLGMKF